MGFIRKSAFSFFASLLVVLSVSNAFAAGENARDAVQSIGDQVIAIVADSKLNDADKEKKLTEMFVKTVDIEWIGKFVAGKYWREATPEQQQKYMTLYKKFLTDSYVSKFRKYTDQKMTITKFGSESEGDYMVETSIVDQDGKSYKVDYKLRSSEGGNLAIYDIIAEGVSMLTTQRSEFSSILSREGMDALIKKLGQKKA